MPRQYSTLVAQQGAHLNVVDSRRRPLGLTLGLASPFEARGEDDGAEHEDDDEAADDEVDGAHSVCLCTFDDI